MAADRSCPHCGAGGLETGATGLDLCDKCGGLSRDGRALRSQHRFQTFGAPVMQEGEYVVVAGVLVGAMLVDDGSAGIGVTYVLADGRRLPTFLVAGALADNFAQLVADAHSAGQRTRN